MPAEVIRARESRGMKHVEIEHSGVRWHLTIKPVRDFNREVIGYKTWLRRHDELHGSEERAVRAACRVVEKLMGEPRSVEVPDVMLVEASRP